jgi:peptide/nickel transport system substrate-binding protein
LLFAKIQERKDTCNTIYSEVKNLCHIIENLPQAKTNSSLKPAPRSRPHLDHSLANLLTFDPHTEKSNKNGKRTCTLAIRADHAKALHPFNLPDHILNLCYGKLGQKHVAHFDHQKFSPELAMKIEKRAGYRHDVQAFWVHLHDGIYWQKLKKELFAQPNIAEHFFQEHPVTAHDFALYVHTIKNPHITTPQVVSLRTLFQDIETVEVVDDLTFIVYFRLKKCMDSFQRPRYAHPSLALHLLCNMRPLPSFLYTYLPDGTPICADDTDSFYETSPLWANAFSNHFAGDVIASCGPYLFDGKDAHVLYFRKNPRTTLPRKGDFDTITAIIQNDNETELKHFMSGLIDVCALEAHQKPIFQKLLQSKEHKLHKQKGQMLQQADLLMPGYVRIGWNSKKPIFSSKHVRKALNLSIHTAKHIVEDLGGGAFEITGPFRYGSQEYNMKMQDGIETHIHHFGYQTTLAKNILHSEGWTYQKGVLINEIQKKPYLFHFLLLYDKDDQLLATTAQRVAKDLKKIHIVCVPKAVPLQEIIQAKCEGRFDAVLERQHYSEYPYEPNLLQQLEHVGLSSVDIELLCEHIKFASDPAECVQLCHKLHKLLRDEAPYAFLYAPKQTLLYWNTIEMNSLKNLYETLRK